jgi:heme-degrading monooxygenase HmoA
MYMRFLRIRVAEERLWDFQHFYKERVVPALEAMPGCLFASLLQPAVPGGECVSMTLWKNPESARSYEDGELFAELLDESRRLLTVQGADARIRARTSPPKAPRAEGYRVVTGEGGLTPDSPSADRLHVRIVTLMVKDEQTAVLAERFRKKIVPSLMALKGCVGAFLVKGADRPTQALSITLWEREEDAVRYELSGTFDALTAKLADTLSGIYLWKHSLSAETEAERGEVTGDDLHIDRYSLAVGWLYPAKKE